MLRYAKHCSLHLRNQASENYPDRHTAIRTAPVLYLALFEVFSAEMHSLLVLVFDTWASDVLVADTTGYHTNALQRQRDQVRVLGRGVLGRGVLGREVLGRGVLGCWGGVPIGDEERDVESGEECRRGVELGEENGVESLRTRHPMPRADPNAHQGSLLRPIPRGSRRRRRLAAPPQRRVDTE